MTSLDPKFWCYLIRGIGSLWKPSWSSLATGIAVWSHCQIFMFSLRAVLTNYLTVRCIIYHHRALHQSFYYIILSTGYNKSTLYTFQELWLESWISILKRPARARTNFPEKPAARSTPAYLISSIKLGIQHIFIINKSGQTFSHYWLCADDSTVYAR